MASFLATYPDVRFVLRGGDSAEILGRIMDGELVLGVVGAREEHPDLTFRPVLKDELVIIAPVGLTDPATEYTVDAAAALPWVLREPGSGTQRAFVNGLEEMGVGRAFFALRSRSGDHAGPRCNAYAPEWG